MEIKKYIAFGLTIETTLNFDGLLPLSSSKTDVSVIEKNVILPTKMFVTNINRKGVKAKFGGNLNNAYLNWNGLVNFGIHKSNKIEFENLGTDEGTLRIFLISEAFAFILAQRDFFLLHGSAVKVNNHSHVFIGVPGAGKSTTATAFYMQNKTILTDDLVCIDFKNNNAFVVPSIPFLKVWQNSLSGLNIDSKKLKPSFEGGTKYLIEQNVDEFPNQAVPLKSITILQKPYSKKQQGTVNPILVCTELLAHWPLGNIAKRILKGDLSKLHFKQSIMLANTVEIKTMNRPKNFKKLLEFTSKHS